MADEAATVGGSPVVPPRAISPNSACIKLEEKILSVSMELTTLLQHDADGSAEYEDTLERLNVMQEELRQRREIITNHNSIIDQQGGNNAGFPDLDSMMGEDDLLEMEQSNFDFQSRPPPQSSASASLANRPSSSQSNNNVGGDHRVDDMGFPIDGNYYGRASSTTGGGGDSSSGISNSFYEMLKAPPNTSTSKKDASYRGAKGENVGMNTAHKGDEDELLGDLAASWVPSSANNNDTTLEDDTTMESAEKGVPVAATVANGGKGYATVNDDDNYNDDDDDDDIPDNLSGGLRGLANLSKASRRRRYFHLTSTLLFIIGSVLYLVMSIMDYQWANELQDLPMYLRRALDDDDVWARYRLEERWNEEYGRSTVGRRLYDVFGAGGDGVGERRGGGVRRMKTRELRMLQAAKKREEERQMKSRELRLLADEAASEKKQGEKEKLIQLEKQAHRRLLEVEEEENQAEVVEVDSQAWETRRAVVRAAKAAKKKMKIAAANLAKVNEGMTHRKLQTPEELYYDECWVDLPPEIQAAYVILGYTETIWDEGGEVSTDVMDWTDLTEEQRQAALFIGYTEDQWCETFQPTGAPAGGGNVTAVTASPVTLSPTNPPTPKPVTASPTNVLTLKPATSTPSKLPTLKPVTGSPTNEAVTLGPTKFSPTWFQPTSTPITTPIQYWTDLPSGIQNVYEQIGYDEASWNDGKKLEIDDKSWEELSFEERFAVISIGFSKASWDATEAGQHFASQPSSDVVDTPNGVVDVVDTVEVQWWADIQADFQSVYAALGYNEVLWNSGGKVAIDDKSWDSMSFEERLAVYSIGFTQETWDDLEEGEHFASQPMAGMFGPTTPKPVTTGPTSEPSRKPVTDSPSRQPTVKPVTSSPTKLPTVKPVTESPTKPVTDSPTKQPSLKLVTGSPTKQPSLSGSFGDTKQPSPTLVAPTPPTSVVVPEVPAAPATPEELYYDEWWRDLPPEIQNAYAALGYNETMWDKAVEPAANELEWGMLNDEQREAALLIGYDEKIWCETAQPTGAPTPKLTIALPSNSTFAGFFGDDNDNNIDEVSSNSDKNTTAPAVEVGFYDGDFFADLSPEIQEAATLLGYNQQLWNTGGLAWSECYDWVELTPEQREAAALLGYDQQKWDTEESAVVCDYDNVDNVTGVVVPAAAAKGNETIVVEAGYYDDYSWVELPLEIQEAATLLGYNQQLWNTGGQITTDCSYWFQLTPEQHEAAALFGYGEQKWDNEESTAVCDDDLYVSYDDDYVFEVKSSLDDVWVSKYQIIYFFAALSFVFVGLLDLIRERHAFHIMMILAGLFGVASAVFVEEDIHLSNILNCVSVHLFLLEGITLFGSHKRSAIDVDAANWMKCSVMLGDLEFAVGALIDVILSYFFLFDDTADWDMSLAVTAIFAAVLWLHCSFIYMGAFFYYPEAKNI